MAFVKPAYSRKQISRAGDLLVKPDVSEEELVWAADVLTNWRACHGYPINTFQATLRNKLKSIDQQAIVAQRLKRTPSIILKLQRFEGMKLARMQDIGGLRAIVGSIAKLKKLEVAYRNSAFSHDLSHSKNYVEVPKDDGYRGIHMIYKYDNPLAPDYEGLSVELQFRTRVQHAWATAVETMGTFLGQALKSGQGSAEWKKFFVVASAALAAVEKTAPVPGYEKFTVLEIAEELRDIEARLHVLEKLRNFAIVTAQITQERGQGAYHLIILDSGRRTVTLKPFPVSRLEQANIEYAQIELRAKAGESVEAVLVAAGPVDALRKAYPNYFLDTHEFVRQISKILGRRVQ
ncbi:RelA/SpoT domain-containing protein [Xanthomonas campestris pv. raphani]|uniref:RelA/SpoT domain-containing protein n=1 Tax=Xanthomonas campestris TaxID=339 RepID=UPI00096C77D6|nr:RelA/SpoT domain-containing protein [Xanthomonas campestris]MCC8487118.1 RelA/SpoT domain-containing protein [Xanthomonas campestris]MEA9481350.1 RelA/SpoT domain-containing protein [Xanthomonas campestris]MEA9649992.1 RelA/SpoT domain-containing protein [Xanthomonas campestris pv. raphani]MEA9659417.1 RelA/SpoT domain-containing protein [Xanthomonas campestris pv. raphani]MEA9727969.1 RelA/SpoT domain-containing protein [Xanthomonas campestris pv. raphani]